MRKISVFVISVEATIYLLLYNLHDRTFNGKLQRKINQNFFFFSKKIYLASPHPILGHNRGDSLTHPILITAFLQFWPKSHRKPLNDIESLSPTERLVGFKSRTFWFLLQRLNPLGSSSILLLLINKSKMKTNMIF